MDLLVIDRSKWLRGEGGGDSCLLRPSDGKMCCLGFVGLACGLTAKELTNKSAPLDVPSSLWPDFLQQTDGSDRFVEINDDEHISDVVREADLRLEFEKHGVRVEFIDGDIGKAA